MWKRKLYPPLSAALRRRFRPFSAASDIPINFQSGLHSSPLSYPSNSRCEDKRHAAGDLRLAARSYAWQAAEDSAARCWNCGSSAQAAPFLACESCRSVQPVDESVDYFQIFGLEKKFEIDVTNLEGKYKDWQKKLHPDLVHTKSQREREYAAEQSSRVIDAYRTLGNPLPRAVYVLKLEGVDVDEEETVSEPELLNEILEIREAVEEAADSQALNKIRSQMEDKLRHWSNLFADAIRCGKLEDALVCVRRMKYYTRVNEQIVKKL